MIDDLHKMCMCTYGSTGRHPMQEDDFKEPETTPTLTLLERHILPANKNACWPHARDLDAP
jgi:hypothetical protein